MPGLGRVQQPAQAQPPTLGPMPHLARTPGLPTGEWRLPLGYSGHRRRPCMQMDRKAAAERTGAQPEEDPRTIADDRGNYAIMHAIARGNNSMAALLDACAPVTHGPLVSELHQAFMYCPSLHAAQLQTRILFQSACESLV